MARVGIVFDPRFKEHETGAGHPERPARLCKECDMRAYCDAKNWNFRKDGA